MFGTSRSGGKHLSSFLLRIYFGALRCNLLLLTFERCLPSKVDHSFCSLVLLAFSPRMSASSVRTSLCSSLLPSILTALPETFAVLQKGFRVRGTVRSKEKGEYLKNLYTKSGLGDKFEYVIVEDVEPEGAFDEAVKGALLSMLREMYS